MSATITEYEPLSRLFYARSTDEVAKDLLGKFLVRELDGIYLVAKIVEVEAYFGHDDLASHACRGMTPRNAVMFGPPGHAYVYLNYGVHWLLNAVTEEEGTAGAALIRAVEPLVGVDVMELNRPCKKLQELGNGPGKLTKALSIGPAQNGIDLTDPESGLFIADSSHKPKIGCSPRIGIAAGTEHLLRFYAEGSDFLSRKT